MLVEILLQDQTRFLIQNFNPSMIFSLLGLINNLMYLKRLRHALSAFFLTSKICLALN